jgi:tetratricopeptide (TPR) repeat protein
MHPIESDLCRAIDLIVDGKETSAARLLEDCETRLLVGIKTSHSPDEISEMRELLGDCYSLQEEHEQALLAWEQALGTRPQAQTVLWKMVNTLLGELEQPALAARILQEQLLPLDPENLDWNQALRIAQAEVALGPVEEAMPIEGDLDLVRQAGEVLRSVEAGEHKHAGHHHGEGCDCADGDCDCEDGECEGDCGHAGHDHDGHHCDHCHCDDPDCGCEERAQDRQDD